jgi:hypothetical protein
VIEITAIRLEGGTGHEHVAAVMWRSGASVGQSPTSAIVEWLGLSRQNEAVAADGSRLLALEVVWSAGAPPHLRTRVAGAWTDDLLSLPRF